MCLQNYEYPVVASEHKHKHWLKKGPGIENIRINYKVIRQNYLEIFQSPANIFRMLFTKSDGWLPWILCANTMLGWKVTKENNV